MSTLTDAVLAACLCLPGYHRGSELHTDLLAEGAGGDADHPPPPLGGEVTGDRSGHPSHAHHQGGARVGGDGGDAGAQAVILVRLSRVG